MRKVSEEEIGEIVRPTALFIQSNKIDSTELANAENTPKKNHQHNGTLPQLSTQLY